MESFGTLIYVVKTFGFTLLKDIVTFVKCRQTQNFNIQLSIQGLPSSHILRSQHLPEIVLGNAQMQNTRQIRNRKSKVRKKIRRRNRRLNSVPAV